MLIITIIAKILCLAVLVHADTDDEIAYQTGGTETTKFGQAKSVRFVVVVIIFLIQV